MIDCVYANAYFEYFIFSQPECQIMDYVTQQYKLFPHLAAFFAFNLSAAWVWEMYNNVTAELDQGELERLPEVITRLNRKLLLKTLELL